MFKDFNISSFKKMKPPGDNTFDTMQEIKSLKKIPLNKKFVKEYDNIEAAFKKTAKDQGVDYDEKIAKKIIAKSAPLILKLKKHFDRPRPKELAKKMNIKIKDIEMDSMKTPSYPSRENISYSRNVARAHYKSDSKMGDKLANAMYKHINNKKS